MGASRRVDGPLTTEGVIADLRKQVNLLAKDNRQLKKRLRKQRELVDQYRQAAGLQSGLVAPPPPAEPEPEKETTPSDKPWHELTQARKARGWSQKQLANKVGVSAKTVSNWEIGRRKPRADHARALNSILGLEISRYHRIIR